MTVTFEEQRTETEKLYDEAVLARVKAGIAFCEATYGPGWVDKIDMETLCLSDGSRCVLGQLEGPRRHYYTDALGKKRWFLRGGYFEACNKYFGGGDGNDMGFCVDGEEWKELQECWEDMLTPKVSHNGAQL